MIQRNSPRSGSVSAGLARSLFDFIVASGGSPLALEQQAGLALAELEDLDGRISLERYLALIEAGKSLTGDGALALHFAVAIDMSEFSIVGLLAHASETMGEAMAQLNRYGKLVMEVDLGDEDRFRPVVRDNALWVEDTRQDPNAFPDLTESTLARLACGPRRFLATPHVFEAHFTHAAPAHAAEIERVFECPVRFSQPWNALRFALDLPQQPVALQTRFAFSILAGRADALMIELGARTTTRAMAERIMMTNLHTGEVNAEGIAGKLSMSRQTLYRRLKIEGVTFEAVLDDLRRRMAIDYIQTRRVSVNEVAYLTGFSEPAAFSRAFKRWTGKSPRDAGKLDIE